ncbi:MAG TPA: hypothetical protein VFW40_04040 [Capsulimonadaceae bacterium]|nr:hypothetical protein [Capsulimonadaceae bacterium]
MSTIAKIVRPTIVMLAALIVILVAVSLQRAVAVTTAPNAAFVTYNLAANTNSAAITPPSNTSVLVMGSNTTSGFRGVGYVTLLHVPSNFLEWVGLNSTSSGTVTQGFSGTAGTKIVQIDFSGLVNLKVNNTDSFVVSNTATFANTGNVTMVW